MASNEDVRVSKSFQSRGEMPAMPDDIRRPSSGGSKMPWIILVIVLVIVIALGVIFRDKLMTAFSGSGAAGKASGYQAVFLSNGQVYFGKMSGATDTYVTLKDVYYLQVTNPPLQGSKESTQGQQPQVSLVKLGNELHAPIDEMKINRDQVLFYEDMKDNGRVMEAIAQYKANPPAEGDKATDQGAVKSETTTAGTEKTTATPKATTTK
jgi:hypothetical protein